MTRGAAGADRRQPRRRSANGRDQLSQASERQNAVSLHGHPSSARDRVSKGLDAWRTPMKRQTSRRRPSAASRLGGDAGTLVDCVEAMRPTILRDSLLPFVAALSGCGPTEAPPDDRAQVRQRVSVNHIVTVDEFQEPFAGIVARLDADGDGLIKADELRRTMRARHGPRRGDRRGAGRDRMPQADD